MISFCIPDSDLRLFLVALNMNFNMPKPDYIFQVGATFEIVYTKDVGAFSLTRVDDFVHEIWEHKNKKGGNNAARALKL